MPQILEALRVLHILFDHLPASVHPTGHHINAGGHHDQNGFAGFAFDYLPESQLWRAAPRQHYGDDEWVCNDLPPSEGETAAGPRFIKNHCEKTVSGAHLIVEQRLFQKKGLQFIDPNTGQQQPQAVESSTRFEMYDAGFLASTAASK